MMPSAPDLEFSSEWRSMVATTSAGVISLPLWNCTPLRILKVQILASSEAPHSSARAGFTSPSGDIWTSCSPHWRPKKYGTWLAHAAGSRLSVAAPPCMPALSTPPFTGVSASARPANVVAKRRRHAERCGAAEEVAAGKAALRHQPAETGRFLHA